MSLNHRIAKLEKQFPAPVKQPFGVDLGFRVAGKPISWSQQEAIRRLRSGIADPRATDRQREQWQLLIAEIEPALRSNLEADKRRACPQCEYPLHKPTRDGGYKCQRCGCPVHVHGDGHVTDARPDVTLERTTGCR